MNFNNKFETYDDNALVQKIVSKELIEFILQNSSDNSYFLGLEIGCGTGIFTSYIKNSLKIQKLILNDLFDTKKYLENISYSEFLLGNIENIEIPTVEIILSSSVLQWIDDLENLILKISQKTNKFSFSIYVTGNLSEIKEHFNISLPYKSAIEIENILKLYFKVVKFYTKSYSYKFDTPLKALKHLKNTGVTGFAEVSFSKLRTFTENNLTYKVAYFYCEK